MPYTLFVTNRANKNNIVNNTGNQVTLNLNPPIQLDNKKNYVMRVLSSQILYCFTNVFTNKNDTITYKYNNTDHSVVFPQGLYSLQALNDEIARQTTSLNTVLVNGVATTAPLFWFVGDYANGTVYIYGNDLGSTATLTIKFSGSTLLPMLGFPMTTADKKLAKGEQYTLVKSADLNTTSSLFMTCDAVGGSSYMNSQTSTVLANIFINTGVFNTIDYEPINPPKIHLTNYSLSNITFTLYDQDMIPVDMNTNNGQQSPEPWSAVIEILEVDLQGRLI